MPAKKALGLENETLAGISSFAVKGFASFLAFGFFFGIGSGMIALAAEFSGVYDYVLPNTPEHRASLTNQVAITNQVPKNVMEKPSNQKEKRK